MGMDNEDILNYFYDKWVKLENDTQASMPYTLMSLRRTEF